MAQPQDMLDFLREQSRPELFPDASKCIRAQFRLYSRGGWDSYGTNDPEMRKAELAQLANTPDLAQVFLFHGDGLVREAALRALAGPIQLPVVAYGLIERLNDWSPEVRSTAMQAFARCFRPTSPTTLLPAIWIVLRNGARWRRWQDGYDRLVDAVLSHDALTSCLVDKLVAQIGGGAGLVYSALARNARSDPFVVRLATEAIQPSLRASAMESLWRGQAFWPLGTSRKVWIDKSLGLYKLETDFGSRPLSIKFDLLPVLSMAVMDRSALVRRKALDGLIAHRSEARFWALIAECLSSLSKDDRPSIRSRLEFLGGTTETTI